MLTLTTSADSAAWQKIDALRHAGWSLTIYAWKTGVSCEVTPPRAKRALREGRTLTAEYGEGEAKTLAEALAAALAAALRDAGEPIS